MSSIALFFLFKGGLTLAVLAFAVREFVVAGRPDADPEFTRKLVHVFSAGKRARHMPRPPESRPAEPALEPEVPRRAA